MHIRKLLFASIAAASLAMASFTDAIDRLIEETINGIIDALFSIKTILVAGWRVIAVPSASLAHITRYLVTTGRMRFAQTRSFIQRAELHPAYSAGHFDPGRQPT